MNIASLIPIGIKTVTYSFPFIFKSYQPRSSSKKQYFLPQSSGNCSQTFDRSSLSLFFRAEARESHNRGHLVGRSCIILGQLLNLPLFILPLLLPVFFDFFFLQIIEITLLTNCAKGTKTTIYKKKTNLFLEFLHSLFQVIIFLFLLEFLFVLRKSRFNLIQCRSLYLHGHAQITLI